jgi:hypothetical protein
MPLKLFTGSQGSGHSAPSPSSKHVKFQFALHPESHEVGPLVCVKKECRARNSAEGEENAGEEEEDEVVRSASSTRVRARASSERSFMPILKYIILYHHSKRWHFSALLFSSPFTQ